MRQKLALEKSQAEQKLRDAESELFTLRRQDQSENVFAKEQTVLRENSIDFILQDEYHPNDSANYTGLSAVLAGEDKRKARGDDHKWQEEISLLNE